MSDELYPLRYEGAEDFPDNIPPRKPERVGRISTKMSKSTNTPEVPKVPKAKYSKTRGEHLKDVVIAVLITGIIAFIGGMVFQGKQQQAIETAVKGASTQTVEAPVKK